MLRTISEIQADLAGRIRARRIGLQLTQRAASERAGVAYRTWRRLEADGSASIEDMIRASLALRCEVPIDELFPPTVAQSLDELLAQQAKAKAAPKRVRKARQS
ncbi:DNA-binding protein [Caulobacter sp. FWC2]|nr:DNA-binding protein [Caulobacter sp. FWC2]